jgi:hypothetical protein
MRRVVDRDPGDAVQDVAIRTGSNHDGFPTGSQVPTLHGAIFHESPAEGGTVTALPLGLWYRVRVDTESGKVVRVTGDANALAEVSTLGPQHRLATYGTLGPGGPNHHQVSTLKGRWSRGYVHGRLVAAGWGADLGFPSIVLGQDDNRSTSRYSSPTNCQTTGIGLTSSRAPGTRE